jgi:hypothetical protein
VGCLDGRRVGSAVGASFLRKGPHLALVLLLLLLAAAITSGDPFPLIQNSVELEQNTYWQ